MSLIEPLPDHPHRATLSAMLETARAVGARLEGLQARRSTLEIQNKSGSAFQDLVTDADLAIDALLADDLGRIAALPYVSEESDLKDSIPDDGSAFWLADPIDGTNNFINGIPMFGSTFALVEAGRAVAGVSVFPLMGLTFYALRDGGVWCNGNSMRVAESNDPAGWMVEVSSQPNDAQLLQKGARMIAGCRAVRILGSIALSLAWVASGKLDLFLGRGHPWDVAVGMLLVEEAGGVCQTVEGTPRNPLRKEMMTAGHAPAVSYAVAQLGA